MANNWWESGSTLVEDEEKKDQWWEASSVPVEPEEEKPVDDWLERGSVEVSETEEGSPLAGLEIPPAPEPLKVEARKPQEGALRKAADVPVRFLAGTTGVLKTVADVFGADSPASQQFEERQKFWNSLVSESGKEKDKRAAEIQKAAEDKGVWEQAKAAGRAFLESPTSMIATGAGSLAPFIAASAAGAAIKGGAAAVKGAQIAFGTVSGAGAVKGRIYEEVKQAAIDAGKSEEEAEALAVEAQSYSENPEQIAAGGALGALASAVGIEATAGRAIAGAARKAATGAQIIGRNIGEEVITEVPQQAQEATAKNIALQKAGFDVPTFRGVAGEATTAGIVAAALGGVAGGIDAVAASSENAQKVKLAVNTQSAAQQVTDVAPLTATAVMDQAEETGRQAAADLQTEADQKITELTETPEQRVARLQREAQEAAGIELEEEVAGLPPQPVTPTPETPPVEPVAPVEPQPIVTEETPPPAPQPPAEAAAPPQPTVAGFTTAKGSTYEVTPEGKTVRTKRSEGRGQGETYEPHSVLFVPSETNYSILSDMQGGMGDYSIRMGYSEDNRFIQVTDTNQIPADVTPQIAIVSRSTQQIIPNGVYDAQRNPEVGFSPVEKLYKPDGTSSTHLGNQITEIRPIAEAAPAAVEPTPVTPPVTPERIYETETTTTRPTEPLEATARGLYEDQARLQEKPTGAGEAPSVYTREQQSERVAEYRNEYDSELKKAKEAVRNALFSGEGRFKSSGPYGLTYLITPSTNPDVLVRVTRLAQDGTPMGHDDIRSESEIESYLEDSLRDGVVRAALEQSRPDLVEGWRFAAVVGRRDVKFRYRLKLRPASVGTQPEGGTIVGEREVEYDRPLTSQELSDFEMEPIGATEVAPTPTPVEPPALAPLRRVARAEQTEEDVAGLVDSGFVEVYKGQPVITQAGLDALPEAERPRLTPEARKIQIDTRTSEAAAEAISKNLRIGVDQVPADVRMPAGWTLVGDVYVPPQPQAAVQAPTPEVREARREPAITPQQDRDYLDAVERGDLDAAQAIVDQVAKDSGYQVLPLFHGTEADTIKKFRKKLSGIWLAFKKEAASPSSGERPTTIINAYADLGSNPITLTDEQAKEWQRSGSPLKWMRDFGLENRATAVIIGDYATVVFQPSQVKSADPVTRDDQGNIIPPSQRFQPEQADIRYARREPAVPRERFYSQLQRTVEAKMPNVSSPEQLKAIIDPARGSGVKPEEVKWSGITEAIDRIASENNGRVPKEAILKYMRDEGAVKFEEVTLSEKIQITPEQNRQIQEEANRVWEQWVDEAVEEAEERGMTRGMEVDRTDVSNNLNRSWDEAESEAMRILGISEEPQTKYQEYQLPEGENYREVVMAMPSKTSNDRARAEELERKFANATITNAELQDLYYLRENADLSTIETYKSPHFKNIPNYVAHMRLNDRKDGDGKEGTFIEEIQSDLHQKAREVGYKDQNIVRQNFVSWLKSNKKELSEQEIQTQFRTQVGEEIQQWLKDQEIAARNDSAVPDAPFRKDWPIQMFKRALEQAVVSGKDWIGWTTGETQASRYDLSKRISKVGFEPNKRGDFSIGELYAYDLDNKLAIRERNIKPEQLADYIGKEAAEKLLQKIEESKASPQRTGMRPPEISGLDLKVGGEGMTGFYDNILPKEIAKYVKKWGATVEKVDIIAAETTLIYDPSRKPVPIWRVNITPEMRRIIQEEGQAVFLRRLRGEPMAGMEQAAVEARLQELGFPTGGIIRVVNEPDADFEGRTIILDGKVTGIELNAAAMRDNATIDRVLNHEFAESANADGALNRLVERLTPKEKKEINDTITRLRYEERARSAEEAARAIETLAEAWKGRGFFTRAVARVEAWASKLGFKLTRRAAEYIAARNLADINAGFRTAYNQFINVRGEVREGRAEDQAVVDADMGRRSQTELTPQEIDQLEKGEKIRVYRAMQIIDGKLYPPMSALVGGKLRKPTEIGAWEKAEERPDLLDKKGKFVLQKGNKTTVPAAYNPYFHTSSSPLNDQFSSAYKRDNLVTVEVEIPASELTSGYKAEGAKDAVGEVRWNAGPVSSKLPADKKRRVFLSRYAKVVRIVPDSEVAEVISGLLEGTNISIPENTVTPSLRSELEKRGVAVTPRPARGQEIRESRREPEAIPTFTEGTPEAATLKEMEASMAKVDAASEAKGGKPETYKISEIASVWMDSGLGERELQDAIVEYTNLTPANAAKVAKAINKQYNLQQRIAEAGAVIAEPAPEAEGAPRKTSVQRLIEQAVGVRRPIVKLEVPEKTALKDQIRLKAREARETRKARKEAARDLAEAVTQYVKDNQLRGPVRARQTMSLAKQALKLDVNNEKAVDRYIMYVERLVENANYDKDLSDAKALRKRAKEMAKKKNIGPEQKKVLEAIGNINPSLLDNPFEYNVLTERYLLGFLPVTSRRYSVMPDAEARQYLESLEDQMKRNQAELDRAELERFFETQAGFAEQRGLSLEEAQNLLNEDGDISQIIQDYELEKRKATEEMLLNLAQNAQRTLKTYDDSANTARQKELISFMKKVKLESITSEEKKRFIRFANNILANGETFGVEQFEAVAKAQERSAEALKDKRLAQKMNAWIGPLSGGSPAEMVKKLSLTTQSEVDTLKNVFGREAVGAFRRLLGLLDLDVAQTASTTEKEKVANKVGDFYKGLKKKYGEDSVGRESNIFTTAAAYFIQAEGNKTQEESIAYRRRLWNENIEELRKSERTEDREESEIKQRALDALTGNNNAEILNSLRSINPAAYEQLMWWKDQMHPEYKPFLKDHVENFRNQANNYDNIDYLSIHYKWDQSPELPSDLDAQEFDDVSSFRIKQAANSIKRKDHPSLPVNPKTGVKANIDVNFGYNQYNALTEQLEKAYTAPAWEAVYAFTRLPDFEQIMGGKTNADFVKNILRNIKATRTRKAMLDDENQVIGGAVALTRRISTQAALGGVLQPFRQIPDQLFKLFATTGRWDLVSKNIVQTLTNYSAARNNPLLNKLPIGRRGDARAGSQFAAEFNELARKVEASVTNKQWTKYKELMTQMGEFWMTPLRGSDTWIAKVSWMSYYESELNKKDIKMESWEREAELFDTDPARQEAASQAEFLVDFYAGASDPTKMAALSKQGNNGWREFSKLIFLSLNSFALQQKSALISDARDLVLRSGGRKDALAGIVGTIGGMVAFHGMRIFIIGGLIYPAAMMVLKGIFGIDMDEPDEEEQEKQLRDNWRKMKASIYSNIVAGGAGQFFEQKSIDAFNRTMYLWDAYINPDDMMDDKGEFISFSKYEKERSPFYRFRSYSKSEFTFGLADVLTEQAQRSVDQTAQLLSDEEMSLYTGNEQAYALFATGVEWAYFFRLMDTDLKRVTTKLKNDMDRAAKEREAELQRIRSGR